MKPEKKKIRIQILEEEKTRWKINEWQPLWCVMPSFFESDWGWKGQKKIIIWQTCLAYPIISMYIRKKIDGRQGGSIFPVPKRKMTGSQLELLNHGILQNCPWFAVSLSSIENGKGRSKKLFEESLLSPIRWKFALQTASDAYFWFLKPYTQYKKGRRGRRFCWRNICAMII